MSRHPGVDIYDSDLKLSVRICLYPSHKSMCCAVAGHSRQHGKCKQSFHATPGRHYQAKFFATEARKKGDSRWQSVTIFAQSRLLHRTHVEHELFHAATILSRDMRRTRVAKAPKGFSKGNREAWWDEHAAQMFSALLGTFRLWVKCGKNAHKVPERLVPKNIFPRAL